MKNSFAAYISPARIKTESGHADVVCTGSSIDKVKEFIDSDNAEDIIPEKLYDGPTKIDSPIGKGVWKFYNQLKSYYEVAFAIDFVSNFMVSGFFKSRILSHAESSYEFVEEYKDRKIYGMDEYQFLRFKKSLDRWSVIDTGFGKLPEALLLSLVASYDSAFADFCKVLLESKPERYRGSDRQYSVAELIKLESLESLILKVVDDEIDQLMNKSHLDQIKYFEKSFDVKIIDKYAGWAHYIELFERRNLAAHGSLIVNDRYVKNCSDAKLNNIPKIGERLVVDKDYLLKSIDRLVEFGVLLAISSWQKQVPDSVRDSFWAIIEIGYTLLSDKRSTPAKNILRYGLEVKSKGADEEQVKMMTVNYAIALRMDGDEPAARKIIQETDWSVCGPVFKLCKEAILGNVDEALKFLEMSKVIDQVSCIEIREWPAFQWIREDEKFQEACFGVFGEQIFPPRKIKAGALTEQDPEAELDSQ